MTRIAHIFQGSVLSRDLIFYNITLTSIQFSELTQFYIIHIIYIFRLSLINAVRVDSVSISEIEECDLSDTEYALGAGDKQECVVKYTMTR